MSLNCVRGLSHKYPQRLHLLHQGDPLTLDLMSCVLYMSTILFWSRDIAKIDRVGMKLCKLGVWLEQDIMLQVSSEYRWNMTAILGCLS